MRTLAIALVSALASCVSPPDTSPVNGPMLATAAAAANGWSDGLGAGGDVVMLSLSGGGARASAFSLGVLQELRDTPARGGGRLIDEVELVTAVSGGSVTAAWFGLHGADGLDAFRETMLDKDWESELHGSFLSPANWRRMLGGGMNDRSQLEGWLNAEVFGGATMIAMTGGPRIIINATELFTGAPFAFTQTYFNAVCSDVSGVLVADAVAASMAVPVFFRPTVVRSFNGACAAPEPAWVDRALNDRAGSVMARETARAVKAWRNPERVGYLHLGDGGIIDNFGVATLIVMDEAAGGALGPFSREDAVRMRRLVFVVVNAEKPDVATWPLEAAGPDGMQGVGALLDLSIDASKRMALEAFRAQLDTWERELVAFRCGLEADEAGALGAGDGWACDDLEMTLDVISFHDLEGEPGDTLGAMATAVSLPAHEIDALIAGGRGAVQANAALQSLAAPNGSAR